MQICQLKLVKRNKKEMCQIVNYKKTGVILFILLQSFYVFSQQSNEMNKLSLLEQFEYTYKKSGTYKTYKVVPKNLFFKLKRNVMDSVTSLQNELKTNDKIITDQKIALKKVNLLLEESNEKIEELTKEKERISFLGIPLKKGMYNTLLFMIIIILASFLGFFIFKFKNSNQITQKAKKDLNELNNEFEKHRTKALEREQKVRRELQDCINKNK